MGVLFFKAIPRPAIWGHTKVRDFFGYDDFPEGIGQSWSFSAQDGEGLSTVCINGEFKGKTLKELWEKHQELFGHPGEDFPVIISLVGPVFKFILMMNMLKKLVINEERMKRGFLLNQIQVLLLSMDKRQRIKKSFKK